MSEMPKDLQDKLSNALLKDCIIRMKSSMVNNNLLSAKTFGDQGLRIVEDHWQDKVQGRKCLSSWLELALNYDLTGDSSFSPSTDKEYLEFFLVYAEVLMRMAIESEDNREASLKDAVWWLSMAINLVSVNADVYSKLAACYLLMGDEENFILTMKASLMFAYRRVGRCSLANAYIQLGTYYAVKGNAALAAALLYAAKDCGFPDSKSAGLIYLSVTRFDPNTYRELLQINNIQVGFSERVKRAAAFIKETEYGRFILADTEKMIKDIENMK